MKTLKEVENVAAVIRESFRRDPHLGPAYKEALNKCGPMKGRDFVSAMLVALGRDLSETALIQCPAADYLIALDYELQREHVANRKPFELLNVDLETVTRKTYDQLTAQDCDQLFRPKGATMVREVSEALDNGDDMQLYFRGNEFTGKVVRRARPET
jgi:hypothetical protein